MSASERFFFKLDIAAGLEDVKTIPGDQPTDAEVDAELDVAKAELKALGQECSFDLDEETLKDWIKSRWA